MTDDKLSSANETAATSRQPFLRVGTVGKASGIRGAFFVSGRDQPFDGPEYRRIHVGPNPETARVLIVESCVVRSDRPLITCRGINSRTLAEELTGAPIWIPAAAVSLDDANEYLWGDLVGRMVTAACATAVGVVTQVQNYGASDVLDVRRASDGARVAIPMVPAWVDMNFVRGTKDLRLVVPAEYFADLWIVPSPQRKPEHKPR